MEEFLRYVICNLVEFPDEVVFTKTETPERTIFHVAMRKTDRAILEECARETRWILESWNRPAYLAAADTPPEQQLTLF